MIPKENRNFDFFSGGAWEDLSKPEKLRLKLWNELVQKRHVTL